MFSAADTLMLVIRVSFPYGHHKNLRKSLPYSKSIKE